MSDVSCGMLRHLVHNLLFISIIMNKVVLNLFFKFLLWGCIVCHRSKLISLQLSRWSTPGTATTTTTTTRKKSCRHDSIDMFLEVSLHKNLETLLI